MKKLSLFAVGLLSLAFLNSCDKVKIEFPEFESPDFVAIVDIPNTNGVAGDTVLVADLSINMDSIIKANTDNKLGVGNIKTMKFKSVVLSLDSADNDNNFANFDEASATISSSANSATTSLFSTITHDDSFATLWEVTSAVNVAKDVATYIVKSGNTVFHYNLTSSLRKGTTKSNVKLKITAKFKIKAES